MTDAFETVLLKLANQAGPGESIGPADVAREVAQETGVEWEQLLRAVRRAAVKLAMDGRAVILLKGEVVDPENFRGIYRIGGANYFTPRKIEPHHAVRHAPLVPAHDYKPTPRPYTPPSPKQDTPKPAAPVASPAPPPQPAATIRLEVRRPAPVPPAPTAPPAHVAPAMPPSPAPAVAPPPVPVVLPDPAQFIDEAMVEEALRERDFAAEIESAFEAALLERNHAPAEAELDEDLAIDEGTPVTRFEYAAPAVEEKQEDFLEEARPAPHFEDEEDELPSPLPPLPSSLSFDDEDEEGYDEDARRAPRPATLDDIASQLERYLAAELNNPPRGDAEIGDDIVGLPGEQDK